MAAVEGALADRIHHVEGLDDRAGRQHLDLEVAARHVVHFLRVVERVFVEDVLGRPGALPAHRDRPGLAIRDHRKSGDRRPGCGRRSGEEFATLGNPEGRLDVFLVHLHPPILLVGIAAKKLRGIFIMGLAPNHDSHGRLWGGAPAKTIHANRVCCDKQ